MYTHVCLARLAVPLAATTYVLLCGPEAKRSTSPLSKIKGLSTWFYLLAPTHLHPTTSVCKDVEVLLASVGQVGASSQRLACSSWEQMAHTRRIQHTCTICVMRFIFGSFTLCVITQPGPTPTLKTVVYITS